MKVTIKKLLRWNLMHTSQVSDELGLVFVHTPKTGGTSVQKELTAKLGLSTRAYPGVHKHAPAVVWREALGRARWNRYRSFAIVRNPWDLMVSCFFWWQQHAAKFEHLRERARTVETMDFGSFMRSELGRSYINEFRVPSLSHWIADSSGRMIVNEVLRFEQLNDDWLAFVERHSLPLGPLPHVNKTVRKPYQEYYDDETRGIVAERFAGYIRQFDYTF